MAYRFRSHYKCVIKHILKSDVKLYEIKNKSILTLCCKNLKKFNIMSKIKKAYFVDAKKLACYLRVKRVGSRRIYIQ